MNVAATAARLVARLETYGQRLLVKRIGLAGTLPKVTRYPCFPTPLTADQIAAYSRQGDSNFSSGKATNFIFAGDADVREGDLILFQGWWHLVGKPISPPLQGRLILNECVALQHTKES